MNHVASCEMHLQNWIKSYKKIVHDSSRHKAVQRLTQFGIEMQLPEKLQLGRKPVKVPETTSVGTGSTETSAVDFSGVVEGRNAVNAAGFPHEAEINVYGLCPNPRLLMGELPDRRKVSVWKGPRNFRLPSKIIARIDLASNPMSPTYLPV